MTQQLLSSDTLITHCTQCLKARAWDGNTLLICPPALVGINFQQLYLKIPASSRLQDPPLLVVTEPPTGGRCWYLLGHEYGKKQPWFSPYPDFPTHRVHCAAGFHTLDVSRRIKITPVLQLKAGGDFHWATLKLAT